MKKISCVYALAMVVAMPAFAGYGNRSFVAEVSRGLDIVGAESNVDTVPDTAPGELGYDVYESVGVVDSSKIRVFVPTNMYMRAGGGLNLGFATSEAKVASDKHIAEDSYAVQIGLGWNLSSYVRAEIDTQTSTFKFADLRDFQANYKTVGATLYFDFARRYVMDGDITRMRHFVPFMGIGAALGHYEFEGADGANGFVVAAPRASLGFNIMFNELIGIDIAYQYQMMIGNGFGWDTKHDGVDSISNVMASFRVNF
ncbi:MAG: hypothetical protein J5679_01685 [Alphaproteobacteria bacterium]|nr:hypothetical protein [Alphaproteobacteria bacterium]